MISTRGRYAIRVMIDLAEHEDGGFIPLKDIAARQEISKKYLEIIAKEMVAGGLLTGASGKGGGYRLCRKPEDYTVGEILNLMEESLCSVACLAGETNDCPRKSVCQTLPMWTEFDRMVHDFFYSRRLSDLLNGGAPGQPGTPPEVLS
ncbi:MAG: Rrf2 family transcriptional regulator [Lachnospiraceae bacterium]|nr:Rrf2 family transcriptional regulator [Lachnospiraceae bacterium]MBP5255345.1 Rrf2 family transcriptional regulator [Lachnospiraceae bacterium]